MEPRAALLKASFETGQLILNAVLADLTQDDMSYQIPGSSASPFGAILAHALVSVDITVQT
jgi:hypothetical protein